MSETKTYRKTGPSKHWAYVGEGENRKHVLLKEGDEVQLTDANYISLRDRFEPVSGPETSEPTAGEADDEAAKVVAGTVSNAVAQIGRISDVNFLDEVTTAESEGRDRAGIYKAIESRISELSESPAAE